ncbi:MAG: HEAT repeat domain-containing protein, partial [Planctomycetes bacterium]|nr:HEAT repeat domain-containing protein [Planctomycetota bacterium]
MFRRSAESVVPLLALALVAFGRSPTVEGAQAEATQSGTQFEQQRIIHHRSEGAEVEKTHAGQRPLPQRVPDSISADLKEQIENLYSPNYEKRVDAARHLGGMKERARPATVYLVDVLNNDERFDVRMWAASALAMTKDARALKPLIDALKDEGGILRETGSLNLFDRQVARRDVQHHVRRFAAYALGELGDREAVKPLAGVLLDEDPEVQVFAANALQKIGDKDATTPLKEALKKEKNEKVRQAIEVAIKELESPKGAEKWEDKRDIGNESAGDESAGETTIDTRVVICDVPADILRRLQDKSPRYLMRGPADKQQTTVIGSGQAGSGWRSTVSEKQPKSGASVKIGTLWLGTPDPSFNVEFELRQEAFNTPFKAEATWHEVNSELVLIGAVSTLGLQFESDETYPITIRCMKD